MQVAGLHYSIRVTKTNGNEKEKKEKKNEFNKWTPTFVCVCECVTVWE